MGQSGPASAEAPGGGGTGVRDSQPLGNGRTATEIQLDTAPDPGGLRGKRRCFSFSWGDRSSSFHQTSWSCRCSMEKHWHALHFPSVRMRDRVPGGPTPLPRGSGERPTKAGKHQGITPRSTLPTSPPQPLRLGGQGSASQGLQKVTRPSGNQTSRPPSQGSSQKGASWALNKENSDATGLSSDTNHKSSTDSTGALPPVPYRTRGTN